MKLSLFFVIKGISQAPTFQLIFPPKHLKAKCNTSQTPVDLYCEHSTSVSKTSFFTRLFFVCLWQKVFQTRKEMVIKKTVARLPLPAVLPLLEEVSVTSLSILFFLFVFWSKTVNSCLITVCFSVAYKEAPRAPFYVSESTMDQLLSIQLAYLQCLYT